ncbi:hypothetical protein [Leptospira noguchii]|uniref:hypothetical protein n=1 Tax=Leptospira noguchii TaxID=28182 RepID=UPI00114730B7|nr:hypothetical protein [Leptospira noguchii]TQE84040.1 hypothetical protein FF021_00315 [Leptospira noguchii]UOG54013.1 hypothetical protein MAL09_07945 [Leptospira noguchii]
MNLKDETETYRRDGLVIMNSVIPKEILAKVRHGIIGVIEEIRGEKINYVDNPNEFHKITSDLIWEILSKNPEKRNLLYQYIQRIPVFYELASSEILNNFATGINIDKPSVRELKIQMYFPWEKCFFQGCHQDINSLDSENSVTYWLPLHLVEERSAVSYWKKSHNEGPVSHEEQIEEEWGLYNVCVPEKYQNKYPDVSKAPVTDGDLIALNRLVFHSSPKFEDQLYARWTVLIRYDNISGNAVYSDKTKYEKYTPFTLKRLNEEILPKIRDFLLQMPKIDWPEEKLKREKLLQSKGNK